MHRDFSTTHSIATNPAHVFAYIPCKRCHSSPQVATNWSTMKHMTPAAFSGQAEASSSNSTQWMWPFPEAQSYGDLRLIYARGARWGEFCFLGEALESWKRRNRMIRMQLSFQSASTMTIERSRSIQIPACSANGKQRMTVALVEDFPIPRTESFQDCRTFRFGISSYDCSSILF